MKPPSSTSSRTRANKPSKLNTSCSLGDVAHQAIQKHFKKSTKYEDRVLADQDPENLHQMRVGMRRLRTAIDVFAPAIELPATAQRSRITKISKSLGKVRDLDVLQLWFQQYLTAVIPSPEETEQIQHLLLRLDKRRHKQFTQLPKLFKSKGYRQFVVAYSDWLEQPQFHAIATMPIVNVMPDLLLPLLSQLFLNPGWLVATEKIDGQPHPILGMNRESLDYIFETEGLALHDLRKQMKRVRYQTEFFSLWFGNSYQVQTIEFQALQTLLGIFQDEAVLSNFLAKELGPGWPKSLPVLARLLQEERFHNWNQWQVLQRKYLDPKFRRTISRRVMSPIMMQDS